MKKALIIIMLLLVIGLLSSSAFAIHYCKDFLEPGNPGGWYGNSLKTFDDEWTMEVGDEVDLDIWVNDVPLYLVSGGFWIQYDPSEVSIVSVDAYDSYELGEPWQGGFTTIIPDAGGPGTYMVAVVPGLGPGPPDGDGDYIIGKVRFRSESEGGATITISTIPGFDTFVGDTTVFDHDMFPNEIVIHQEIDYCEGDFDNDGDQDGLDAALFKTDFGRSPFSNPCPSDSTTTTIPGECPYGMVDCGTKCVDPMTDEDYCGVNMNCLAGTVCGTGKKCNSGLCLLNCPPGQTQCAGLCVDTDTNEGYCGSCTNSCVSGEMCVSGSCELVASCAPPAQVPKTGQTTSYATGDDGDLETGVAWPNPRFMDNLDGTVTDNLTGLTWLKDANCFGQRTWSNALSDSNGLASGSCGLSDGSNPGDWRLPNRNELDSLVHNGYTYPTLPNTAGTGQWSEGDPFNNVQSSGYWSSTTDDYSNDVAWGVVMSGGRVYGVLKASNYYVWPVRGDNN